MAGFGSSLVLVKLCSGIKPLSPESKDNNGPGGAAGCYHHCMLFELLSQTRDLHSIAEHGFHLSYTTMG